MAHHAAVGGYEKEHRPDLDLDVREPATAARKREAAVDAEPSGDHEAEVWATLAVDHKGGGEPVDPSLAAEVGAQTGVDVSGARVHTDPRSRAATRKLGARAFAHGTDIFLGPNESQHDRALVAHELAHVAQQQGGAKRPQRKVAVGTDGSATEQHADDVATAVAASAAPTQLISDGAVLAPGQMTKAQFLATLQPAIVAVVEQELGKLGAAAGCPYIERYFAKYSAEPASAGESLIRHWIPAAKNARSAGDLIPLVLVRVRDAVRSWHTTGRLPPDLAAADPAAGADATLAGLEAQLGTGSKVDSGVASKMSATLGTDVTDTRVHTGPVAAAKAAEHGATAFAVGNNIVMGANAPAAGTLDGDALLAHELAHTAQQKDAARDPTARIGGEDEAAEANADKLAALGTFAGRVGDVMRTGVQLQRCQVGGQGIGRESYYRMYLTSMTVDAANHLRTLPFATYDSSVTWTANGAQQFAQKMADQIVAPPTTSADLDSLVRPEMIGKLIDQSRVMTKEPNSGITTEQGADAYFPGVGVEIGNALARRTAESLQREVPRYAQARLADGREPAVGDIVQSHPIDPLVVAALAQGNVVAIDGATFRSEHPELAGAPKRLNQTRNVRLEIAGGGGYWYRLIEPQDATIEEVALALTGSATEAFRLENAHPLYGLKGDTRGTLKTENDFQNPAGVLVHEGGALADEAALAQAGTVATASARSRARILENMRLNATLMKTSVREAAQRFGLGRLLDESAKAIDDRAARLSAGSDSEISKWDAQTTQQASIIQRGARGLEIDFLRLQTYATQFGGDLTKDPAAFSLPEEHRQILHDDAELWTRAVANSDLVGSADKQLLAASQHSMTLEIEILERGLGSPQAAVYGAKDAQHARADFDVPGMAKRELDMRQRLGQMRAQMMVDPTKVDAKANQETNEETRNLIFESQVVSQASSLDQAWSALDDADGWMSSVSGDSNDLAKLKREGKGYYTRWKAIYANIKKGETGDKDAMQSARSAFETLCKETEFQSYLSRVNELLKKVQKHHLIVTLIAMVVITVASMGAGAAISGFLGGTTLVVEGTEVVVGGIGVARNTAAVAGFITEVAMYTYLSNRAFSKDHSVGSLAIEFGKNLIMFGAMRGVAAGFKAAGLTRVMEEGFKDGASIAAAMKGAGVAGLEVLANGTVGVLMGVIEAKVREKIGGKPMTEDEVNNIIKMTVAQTVIMTIAGRLLISPIKTLQVKAAFQGKQWRAAVDGWALENKAISALQGKAGMPEEVVEAAARDRAQIEKEIAALQELRDLAERDPKALEGTGVKNAAELGKQIDTLHTHADRAMGIELALSMKELAPNHYECPRGKIADVLATHNRLKSGIDLEATDPETGARTWKITPNDAPPFHITETMPDWALTPTGKRVISAAKQAGIDDATVFQMSEAERVKLLAADEALQKSGLDPALLHRLEEALVAAGRSKRAIDAVGRATSAQLQALAKLADVSPQVAGKLLEAVGLDAANHTVEAAPDGQVRINGELEIHPTRLDEITDADLATILEASKSGDTERLRPFSRSGSYRLRFRFQLRQNETWLRDVLARINRDQDPVARRILDSLDDAGRTRLQESRTGALPRGVDTELQDRAAAYALDHGPQTARDFVDLYEMFTSEFLRVRKQTETAIRTRTAELEATGQSQRDAERAASKEKLGSEVQGFGSAFNRIVLDRFTSGEVEARAQTLARELGGQFGARQLGHPPEPANVVAEVRALPPLQFATEASGTYHPNKHPLPAEHNLPAYGANEVSRYLRSANETIQTGVPDSQRSQDGGFSIAFTKAYGPKTMRAIVRVDRAGNAVIATYGDN